MTNQSNVCGFLRKPLKPSKKALQNCSQPSTTTIFTTLPLRAKADWLVGLNVTRALTVKYQDNLSAGRVQTPTLALVRSQEMQIESFRPQTYHVITLNVGDAKARLQQKSYQLKNAATPKHWSSK